MVSDVTNKHGIFNVQKEQEKLTNLLIKYDFKSLWETTGVTSNSEKKNKLNLYHAKNECNKENISIHKERRNMQRK